jgi:hypothetical protein
MVGATITCSIFKVQLKPIYLMFKSFFSSKALLLILIAVFLISCTDNDDDGPVATIVEDQFTVNNVSYNLDVGYRGNTVSNGDIFVTTVALLEDSAIRSAQGFTGVSNFIVFELYTSDNNGLQVGTYDIRFDDEDNYDAYSYFGINIDLTTGDGDVDEDLDGGIVTISFDETTGYTFLVSAQIDDINNTPFSATFQGDLTLIPELGNN